jgi:hypothetical protein
MATALVQSMEGTARSLPEGWEVREDFDDGRYFYHEETGVSTSDDPRSGSNFFEMIRTRES